MDCQHEYHKLGAMQLANVQNVCVCVSIWATKLSGKCHRVLFESDNTHIVEHIARSDRTKYGFKKDRKVGGKKKYIRCSRLYGV